MTTDAKKEFEQVRQNIDKVDKKLVELIAERLSLTKQVGTLKAKLQLPLYVPTREAELIKEKRQLAIKKGISADLVEDVLRRIMRDSYLTQNNSRAKVTAAKAEKIVVIGGRGQLGSLFVDLFKQSGYQVDVLEKDNWNDSNHILANASLVLVAVPIRNTSTVIKQLKGLPKNCILADITSVKETPVETMLKVHSGAVIGLHPMFGPGIKHLAKQTIVVCEARPNNDSGWLIEQLKSWGANLTFIGAKEHDQMMAIVQVLRHFSTVAYGYHLMQENISLDKILELSSPIYRLELVMVGRLFAQNSELYSDIIFSDKKNIAMIKRFLQRLKQLLELLDNNDVEGFATLFDSVSDWFGSNADRFLQESNQLLAKTSDLKK